MPHPQNQNFPDNNTEIVKSLERQGEEGKNRTAQSRKQNFQDKLKKTINLRK